MHMPKYMYNIPLLFPVCSQKGTDASWKDDIEVPSEVCMCIIIMNTVIPSPAATAW